MPSNSLLLTIQICMFQLKVEHINMKNKNQLSPFGFPYFSLLKATCNLQKPRWILLNSWNKLFSTTLVWQIQICNLFWWYTDHCETIRKQSVLMFSLDFMLLKSNLLFLETKISAIEFIRLIVLSQPQCEQSKFASSFGSSWADHYVTIRNKCLCLSK